MGRESAARTVGFIEILMFVFVCSRRRDVWRTGALSGRERKRREARE